MNIFCNSDLIRHDPRFEIFNGEKCEHADKPTRIDSIIEQLDPSFNLYKSNFELSMALLYQVHTSDYIDFLAKFDTTERSYPSVYNYSEFLEYKPTREIINLSNYCFDTFTPFSSDIFGIAKESAELALSAMNHVHQNQKVAYALCRPPGHHATGSKAGGYCYLANASLVSQELINRGYKVAILDIDYHHGNGAQEIWYESDQVLTISIHRDEQFPYFSGKECEKGKGVGIDWNHNLTFGKGIEVQGYLELLQKAVNIIQSKNVDYIIVSAGFDTYYQDPICDAGLTIENYNLIAQKIKSINLPTIILQEGGYHIEDLGKCVNSFLSAWK